MFNESGFSFYGRQAFSKGNDLFYSSIQSVVSNCVSIVSGYNEYEFRIDRPSVAVITMPVIVVDGFLYEASFNEMESDLDVVQIKSSRLRWRGNNKRNLNTLVDIVTKDSLNQYLEQRIQEVSTLTKSWSETFEQLINCFNEQTERHLKIKEGPRGIHGRPLILSQLREISASYKQNQADA